ncbi:uncharacterized protein LOC123548919 [Mercenaria mercenaria]|uniref:uncharacterized protein LOC123548919 n=1 Tax=Mercenaria mercenaria TaxID=6596 RepID=UPI00234EA18B|nr:uncharacterized protein LOC123548919 [Mercenaria mercenaria]
MPAETKRFSEEDGNGLATYFVWKKQPSPELLCGGHQQGEEKEEDPGKLGEGRNVTHNRPLSCVSQDMADVAADETAMLIDKTETEIPGKLVSKQNGLDADSGESTGEKPASLNGVSDACSNGKSEEIMDTEAETEEDKPLENGNTEKAENSKAISDQNEDAPVVLSDNNDSDIVESLGSCESPVVVNSDVSQDGENSSEAMEVESITKEDEDSNVVELSSNVSAHNSDIVEVGHNDSNNPSLISEESSRDSVESGESIKKTRENKNGEIIKEKDEKVVEEKSKSLLSATDQGVTKTIPVTIQPAPTAVVSSFPSATNLIFQASAGQVISSAQNFIVQGTLPSIPVGSQLVRQGNQLGYVSVNGNQHIFVPVNNAVPASVAKNPLIANQLTPVQQQQKTNVPPQLKPEDLRPKSSWEMIELMKWEIQNRVPDNYNWSVAFHGRKEELSSVSSFLQELGSDVVKEQVYKDIIQIQTKKKIAGDLKEPEIESLEKMKTVYENTKKKVEHLQLETKECDQCEFKTESSVIMNYHKDFPHYDPPWDMNKGWLMCAHCDFKTKTPAHYIFHEKDIHNVQAKFVEKEQLFQCSLCPLNASTKNKLEKHQQKCMKHFKLNANLQPYYHDVNFCMKTCFYKPKKVVPKPPPPKPTAKPTMLTRQQGTVPVSQTVVQQTQAIRPNTNVAIRQRLPVMRSPMPPQQNVQRPPVPQQRPRLTPPALQRAPVPQQKPVRPPGREMSGFEVCELCGGYVKDRQALRIHFYYAHKVEMPQAIFNRPLPPLTCDVCKSHYWTTHGLTKHKTAQRHFIGAKPQAPQGKISTEMECFMCMKRFPNLFVHFEKIHGMTMKDLVLVRKCIMCGLAANDYKSLEAHLVNTHGILIKVNDYINDRTKPVRSSPNTSIIGGGKNVGKINYCVFCQIQFPDNIQLTMHCIKIHATCRTCGMVVATSKHLADHSCRKAHINRSCYICGTIVTSQEKYALHLRSHVKPCRVKIENLTADEIIEVKEKIKREYKPAVISLDSDEDSDVEVVETKPSNMKVVLEKDKDKDVEMVDLSEDADEKSNDNKSKTMKKENDSGIKKEMDNRREKIENESDVEVKNESTNSASTNDNVKEESRDESESTAADKTENDNNESENAKKETDTGTDVTENKKSKVEVTNESENSTNKGTVKEESNIESDSTAVVKDGSVADSENGSEGALKQAECSDPVLSEENLKVEDTCIKEDQDCKAEILSESVMKEKIHAESKENDESETIAVKSVSAESETLDEFKSETETLYENLKKDVENKESNNVVSNESEAELEERLLGKDDEDSTSSSGSCKRKKSESDIDEDELLREDDNTVKRTKVEAEDENTDKSAERNDTVLETEQCKNEDKSIEDVEMGESSSVGDTKMEEI